MRFGLCCLFLKEPVLFRTTTVQALSGLARNEQIMQILRDAYGDEAERWFQRWRVFFMACAELFGSNYGNEWFVGHYLFRKRRGGAVSVGDGSRENYHGLRWGLAMVACLFSLHNCDSSLSFMAQSGGTA